MENPLLQTQTPPGQNLAETLAKELKTPIEIGSDDSCCIKRIALPSGWTLKEFDDEKLLPKPRRKSAKVRLSDVQSFVAYANAHAMNHTTIWIDADHSNSHGKIDFIAIINDLGQDECDSAWRDHIALYSPKISEEWKRWIGADKKPMTQSEFATFIEDNLPDIAGGEGFPSGTDMLRMAIDFEAKQDMRFKSAFRLQSGGVDLAFVQQEDNGTIEKMKLFDRFAIGVPVFCGEDAYRVEARLRYRVRDGKLSFWYEIIRPDRVMEAAANALVDKVSSSGIEILHGKPFA